MLAAATSPVSGHIYRQERQTGPRWVAKWRDDAGQHKRVLGKAWTGKGRPSEGYFTKRTAQQALDEILADARRGSVVPAKVRTHVTFADVCDDFLRWMEQDRQRKQSTLNDYGSAVRKHFLPAFGSRPLEQITPTAVERWRAGLVADGRLSNRSINKLLTVLHGIFERARKRWGVPVNPLAEVEKQPRKKRVAIDVYGTDEVIALVRAAESTQDAAIFLTAAFTGLRMGELLALRWRDVDFELQAIRVRASYTHRQLGTPKNKTGRTVPMIARVATTLARLSQRERFTGPDDLVFCGTAGGHLDDSALRRRYKRARDRA